MDLTRTLLELRQEKERIDEAIACLERLAASQAPRRRGRPPKWLAAARKKGGVKIATPRK